MYFVICDSEKDTCVYTTAPNLPRIHLPVHRYRKSKNKQLWIFF